MDDDSSVTPPVPEGQQPSPGTIPGRFLWCTLDGTIIATDCGIYQISVTFPAAQPSSGDAVVVTDDP